MDRLSAWFPALVLAGIAGLTWWLDQAVQPPPPPPDPDTRQGPDFVVEEFAGTRFGEDGKPLYVVSGQRMTHFLSGATTLVDEPRVSYSRPGEPEVRASSKRGQISGEGDHVYLEDDVLLVREAYGDRGRLTLTTTWLHVVPELERAVTDRPVTITDANTVVDGVGLEFDHAKRTAKLLSNVRVEYQPPR